MSTPGAQIKVLSWLRHQDEDEEIEQAVDSPDTTHEREQEFAGFGCLAEETNDVPKNLSKRSWETKNTNHSGIKVEFSPPPPWSRSAEHVLNSLLPGTSSGSDKNSSAAGSSLSTKGTPNFSPDRTLHSDSESLLSPLASSQELYWRSPSVITTDHLPPSWHEQLPSFTKLTSIPITSSSLKLSVTCDLPMLPKLESLSTTPEAETANVKHEADSPSPVITELTPVADIPSAENEIIITESGSAAHKHSQDEYISTVCTPRDLTEIGEWITPPSTTPSTDCHNPASDDWTENACYVENVPIICTDVPYFLQTWTPVPFPDNEQAFGLPVHPVPPHTMTDNNRHLVSCPNYEYEYCERPPTPTIHDFPDLLNLRSPDQVEENLKLSQIGNSQQHTAMPISQSCESPVEMCLLSTSATFQELQEQQLATRQSSNDTGPIDFALWALKSLLPTGKQLKDKGSILHATADYIERLHSEIKQYMQQLGLQDDEEFWASLRRNPTIQSQTRTKKKKRPLDDDRKVRRPPNAFIRFSVEFRRMVANDFPGRNNREVSQMLGSIWRKMSAEEKAPFVNKFYEELKQTRENHPDWNYAGPQAKRFSLDPTETKPERLRPRNHKQQVSYKDLLQRRYVKHKSSKRKKDYSSQDENTPDIKPKQVFWVQCDDCNKWRKLPTSVDSDHLPEKWTCFMNPESQYNTCDKAEEME